ncbi:MAG TPA: GTPase, partial [Nitrospiria bacterium]|nr:GTPase [Nitrospiria bacterium]
MKLPIIAIIGRPNVGKSAFFNKLLGKRIAIVEDQPGVTRDRNYAPCSYTDKEFTLVDTGGLIIEGDEGI